jgi:hypothetical protein
MTYLVEKMIKQGRKHEVATALDEDLGPLKLLPGHWRSEGRGWNMIALPFATQPPPAGFDYRVLMNQYNEDLKFTLVDKGVPNRGISGGRPVADADQFVVTLDYQQSIDQVTAADFPVSDKTGDPGLAIHHEPGLWLHMLNETTNSLNIARLASIPHGDSVLALGESEEFDGPPQIPTINGLPIGVKRDFQNDPYLAPYKHFIDNPFFGTVPVPAPGDPAPRCPGFHPLDLSAMLNFVHDVDPTPVIRTTVLQVDSTLEDAGIVNLPFIVKQANAASVKSTFWIQELDTGEKKNPNLRLQYSQIVILDFFPRPDGLPGRERWPHVSINTLDKVSDYC